jgi:uncharacterized protein YndB with AHSA1/START domain
MSQLEVEATGETSAEAGTVWSLVADANRYPQWGPWKDGGYRPPAAGPSRPGQIQWFRYGRRSTTVEKILEVDEDRRLVYTVARGLPVRNYRAEVTLTPTPSNGTSIRWRATWDRTLMGVVVRRKLQQVYVDVVGALVAAADHSSSQRASASPSTDLRADPTH